MLTKVLLVMVVGGAGWRLFGDLCAALVGAAVSLAHQLLPRSHRPLPDLPDPTGQDSAGFWRTHTALQAPEHRP